MTQDSPGRPSAGATTGSPHLGAFDDGRRSTVPRGVGALSVNDQTGSWLVRMVAGPDSLAVEGSDSLLVAGPDSLLVGDRVASPDQTSAGRDVPSAPGRLRAELPDVVHEFTEAWERGASPTAEQYLGRLDPADSSGAVDLIYREFCLAEADGRCPDPMAYAQRFPRHAEALRQLLRVHDACPPSMLRRLFGSAPGASIPGENGPALPEAGDSIGPYLLRRELGRGSFARVFLAEQADLENRLVVVKVAARSTREPWLLARAQHAHIVEIVSHAVVDDVFQLICMPFWGGATLADVLAARPARSRQPGGRSREARPTTGRDLLAALDAVSAPEYPSARAPRPARELLARLSYDQAIAWIIARLAEALDHASGRGVAHGDVKPSNILLSADGNPMLLDFNLARDEGPSIDPGARPVDPGGTLAYMAPERLRAIADLRAGSGADPASGSFLAPMMSGGPGHPSAADSQCRSEDCRAGWPGGPDTSERSAHVADLYSLGMVFLEALCGRPPSTAIMPDPAGGKRGAEPDSRPARLRSSARAFAEARARPARALLRDFESATGRTLSPAVRAILLRCLDPDPDRRYRRASELAEDLDRWRTDRPIAYADEPFWRQTVPRWLRTRRRALSITAGLIAVVGMTVVGLMLITSSRLMRHNLEDAARAELARRWDDPGAGAFRHLPRRPTPRAWEPDDPGDFEAARRALVDYHVLARGDIPATGDWRLRDAVRLLPPPDREDLEIWLLENTYRYCRALEDRPDSPDDWRAALVVMDRASDGRSLRAFAPIRGRLAAALAAHTRLRGAADPAAGDRDTDTRDATRDIGHLARAAVIPGQDARSTNVPGQDARVTTTAGPAWLDEYLLGFVAECEPGPAERESRAAPSERSDPDGVGGRDLRPSIERALVHYERMLTLRPGSFWGHYRAAAVCFGLSRTAESVEHLMQCLDRRPDNAVVAMQIAGCLIALKHHHEALEFSNRALDEAPSYAEIYRTRGFARLGAQQIAGLTEDIRRYEMFRRILPREYWSLAGALDPFRAAGPAGAALPVARQAPFAQEWRALDFLEAGSDADRDEIEARLSFAELLKLARQFALADAELEKILVLRPRHIPARLLRAQRAIADRRFDAARADLAVVLNHPGLEDYVRTDAAALLSFFDLTLLYLKAGRADEARRVAEPARDLAIRVHRDVGRAHFYLASVYAVLGKSDPNMIEQSAKQLRLAYAANLTFRKWYEKSSRWFDPVRVHIDASLARMKAPVAVRRRPLVDRPAAAERVPGG